MATRLQLLNRIADDIGRSDLSTQISEAVADALRYYEGERFHFNAFYRLTATISAGASIVPLSTLGVTPLIVDRVALQRNSSYWAEMEEVGAEQLENLRDVVLSTEPIYWAHVGDNLQFDCSAQANYAIVVDGVKSVASASASASDGDTSAWYNEARDLIRAAAKKSLYLNVIKEDDEAQRAQMAEAEALKWLRSKTVNKRATGYTRPQRF